MDTTILSCFHENDLPTIKNYKMIWVCYGWQRIHEFIGSIPQMEVGSNYNIGRLGFRLFVMASTVLKNNSDYINMGC